ncbi:MAG: helix-turn-helix domain-containing protein [Coprobacillaceae bacterium]
MAILKNKLIKDYTMIPNWIIYDTEISDNAFRLLAYLYSKPDDWNVIQKNIAKDLGVGTTSISRRIKELKKHNALEVKKVGFIWEYHLNSNTPNMVNPKVVTPNMVNPKVVKHNKTDTTKTNNTNTDNTNKSIVIDNYFENPKVDILFNEFLKNRIALFGKNINTELSVKRIINKLNEYDDEQKIQMLNIAIERGYRSVFINQTSKSNNTKNAADILNDTDW